MTKNEIVAVWMGWKPCECGTPKALHYKWGAYNWQIVEVKDMKFDQKYDDWFMPAWVKFRDLESSIDNSVIELYKFHRYGIGRAIIYESITEAFDELVKGITWHQSLNK